MNQESGPTFRALDKAKFLCLARSYSSRSDGPKRDHVKASFYFLFTKFLVQQSIGWLNHWHIPVFTVTMIHPQAIQPCYATKIYRYCLHILHSSTIMMNNAVLGRRFAAALLPRVHDCSGRIPGHTTREPPVGFELETNGFQFYDIANLDKTCNILVSNLNLTFPR